MIGKRTRSKRGGKKRESVKGEGWLLPATVSLLLHSLAVALLLLIVPTTETRKVNPVPRHVSAKMVTLERPEPAPKKPVPVAEKPAPKPIAKPRPDQQAIALKQKQAEERKKKQAEERRREERRKADLRRESERKLAEQREHERLERERRERKQKRLEQLQKQQEEEMLAALDRDAQAAEQAREDAELAAGYVGIIRQLVERQWIRPASARQGMKTVLRIQLLPTGELIKVRILAGSGNEAFDRSAYQSVERAAPFTELQDMEPRVFEENFRTLRFVFNPEDLLE